MNYQRWITHFQNNRLNRPEPHWDPPLTMPERKRRLQAASLAEHQFGDGGGGHRKCLGVMGGTDGELFRHERSGIQFSSKIRTAFVVASSCFGSLRA